jgi:hypothetical protein
MLISSVGNWSVKMRNVKIENFEIRLEIWVRMGLGESEMPRRAR